MAARFLARPSVIGGLLAALLCSTAGADTLKGVALAIGQSGYATLADLPNTARDAKGIEDLLGRLGFETDAVTDRDARQLRRDIEGFADDAQGADVAVLYYAGHAVEIGGQNYLLPTDVDASSPEALARGLVPLADSVETLRRNAKLVIVLLDACRDNPLPPNTTVRLTPEGEPQAVTMAGAGMRGVEVLLKTSDPATGNLGMVIGFAAEPGKTALDGAPGTNSPYAAALLRHLSAMAGEEFGTVMRMVAEEVYLKTQGRQRPWVNESMRRQLYFGQKPGEQTGVEGDILRERRKLLVTIAELPAFERTAVERIAGKDGLPMDAVYGMLKALGQEASSDPKTLETLLRKQAEELKVFLARRTVIESPDAELQRLSRLSGEAVREGAIAVAQQLRSAVDSRIAQLETTVADVERDVKRRRIEFAAEHATTAEIHALASDYLKAADYYERAFDQVSRWDDKLAHRYRNEAAAALQNYGDRHGDLQVLRRAARMMEQARAIPGADPAAAARSVTLLAYIHLAMGKNSIGSEELERAADLFAGIAAGISPQTDPRGWAAARSAFATTLSILGSRASTTTDMNRAADIYRETLADLDWEKNPEEWSAAQLGFANTLFRLSESEADIELLEKAIAAFELVLDRTSQKTQPRDWAMIQMNVATALATLAKSQRGEKLFLEAIERYRSVLEIYDRDTDPLDWALATANMATVHYSLGSRRQDAQLLGQSADEFRQALEIQTRERGPTAWASTQVDLGNTLSELGSLTSDIVSLRDSVTAYRAALQVYSRDHTPLSWGSTQSNIGYSLSLIARLDGSTEPLEDAVRAFRLSFEVVPRERDPLGWATAQRSLGIALKLLGDRKGQKSHLEEAVSAYRAALKEYKRDRHSFEWAWTQSLLGEALYSLAGHETGTATLKQAADAYRASLEERTPDRDIMEWAQSQRGLSEILMETGRRDANPAVLAAGIESAQSAWYVYKSRGEAGMDVYFGELLAKARMDLEALRKASSEASGE